MITVFNEQNAIANITEKNCSYIQTYKTTANNTQYKIETTLFEYQSNTLISTVRIGSLPRQKNAAALSATDIASI